MPSPPSPMRRSTCARSSRVRPASGLSPIASTARSRASTASSSTERSRASPEKRRSSGSTDVADAASDRSRRLRRLLHLRRRRHDRSRAARESARCRRRTGTPPPEADRLVRVHPIPDRAGGRPPRRPRRSISAACEDLRLRRRLVSLRLPVPRDVGRVRRDDAPVAGRRVAGATARSTLDLLLGQLEPALAEPHPPRLEEYAVCHVDRFAEAVGGADLLDRYGASLAQLILGEERRLMRSEQEEALRVNFAYYEDELTVIHWETAFVYDRADSAQATEDILEFANTQLVELRTYDAYLDGELDAIYRLGPERPVGRFFRHRASKSAERLRYLIVDVLEITDRVSNALKIIGDAYYARLYRGAAGRLGLADWQRQIDTKLRSVEEMYRFSQDRIRHARDEALELIIIVLILIEVVTGILALRH